MAKVCKDCGTRVGGLLGFLRRGYHCCNDCNGYVCTSCVIEKDGTYRCTGCHRRSQRGGCFIATAAWGTPFAEEINILRFWRDNFLKSNTLGNSFTMWYYKTSPPIADFISDKKILRWVVRTCLKPYVILLKLYYGNDYKRKK